MARVFAAVLLVLSIAAGVTQAHEIPGCSFPANVSSQANLTVAGAALEALDGSDIFGSHDTVFLPTDAAFEALLEDLGLAAPENLLTPELQNTTIAILAYHGLGHAGYSVAQLVGNGTLNTNLGELLGEDRNLTFASAPRGRVQITSVNTTAVSIESEPKKLCGRTVYSINTVLIPTDEGVTDIPTDIPAAIEERKAEEEAAEADQAAPRTFGSALPLAAVAVFGASLLLQAL